MRPPDPESRRAASLRESDPVSGETRQTVGETVDIVNKRFCRPIEVQIIARQIFEQLRQRFESGSDFEARRLRARAAAQRKGRQ
jgi:hypothetical protein